MKWEDGREGTYMQTRRTLEQAHKRLKPKQDVTSSSLAPDADPGAAAKLVSNRVLSRQVGPRQQKDLCVCCMRPPQAKKKAAGPFHQIQ